jgi:uncharacterized protein YjbI with pentapeptide repeats
VSFVDELKRCLEENDVLGGTFEKEVITNIVMTGVKIGVLNFHKCTMSNFSVNGVEILYNLTFSGCVLTNVLMESLKGRAGALSTPKVSIDYSLVSDFRITNSVCSIEFYRSSLDTGRLQECNEVLIRKSYSVCVSSFKSFINTHSSVLRRSEDNNGVVQITDSAIIDYSASKMEQSTVNHSTVSKSHFSDTDMSGFTFHGSNFDTVTFSRNMLHLPHFSSVNGKVSSYDELYHKRLRKFCVENPPTKQGGRLFLRTQYSYGKVSDYYMPGNSYEASAYTTESHSECTPGLYACGNTPSFLYTTNIEPFDAVIVYVRDGEWTFSEDKVRCKRFFVLRVLRDFDVKKLNSGMVTIKDLLYMSVDDLRESGYADGASK